MSMIYKLNDLTEEIFGHLCNVALNKCSDKFEKKKAGCGGKAMRKRVLIKNFVSDLFKLHKKPDPCRDDSDDGSSSDEEYDEFDTTFYEEEELEELQMEDLTMLNEPYNGTEQGQQENCLPSINGIIGQDCWMAQPNMYQNDQTGYVYGFDDKPVTPYSLAPSTPYYDLYSSSSVSEQATEGDMPSASDPMGSILPSSENGFDLYPSSSLPSNGFYTSDDYFLASATEHNYLYGFQEETHELTDLDVATGESHANKNKRRHPEMYEDFNMNFQKRIKI